MSLRDDRLSSPLTYLCLPWSRGTVFWISGRSRQRNGSKQPESKVQKNTSLAFERSDDVVDHLVVRSIRKIPLAYQENGGIPSILAMAEGIQ